MPPKIAWNSAVTSSKENITSRSRIPVHGAGPDLGEPGGPLAPGLPPTGGLPPNYKNAINQVFVISITTKQLYIVYNKISYHKMCSVKLKMHQNPFRPGLRPGPRWGSLRRSPRPPSRLGRGYLCTGA